MKISPFLAGCLTVAGFALTLAVTPLSAAGAAKQLWTAKLPGEAKWHKLTELGTLLVGTADAIACFNPDDGKLLWTHAEFKKTNPRNAVDILGTPLLVCNTYDGLMNSKVTFSAIDYFTGEQRWATPQVLGQYLDTIPVPAKNLVIFVVNTYDGSEPGIYLMAHDLETGAPKWSTKFAKSGGIPLHMADNSGRFLPTMDLSGYHEPIFDGDEMYLGYLGVHCVDLTSGAVKWGVTFPQANKALKKTYAPLRIDGDRIYGAGGGSVYAINRRTGATPVEAFKVPIEFKRKMGAGSVAKIGLGALGGVSGLVKAGMSANKGLLDVPVAVTATQGRVVVQGKQHLLGFDPVTKTSNWSLFYAAPSDTLGNVAMFAVTALAAVGGNAQVAASGGIGTSGYSSGVSTIHSNLDSYNRYTEKAAARAGQSKATESYAYILTKVEKDIGIVGVNLTNGESDRQLVLKEKEPDYIVDEPANRIFHFKDKDSVQCYQF